jgi:hypothetical protein
MTPRDFAPIATAKPHGHRGRYAGGCRCEKCRKANTDYERYRIAARRDGDFNGLVDAKGARAHLIELSKHGIGRRMVERLTGVASTVIWDVRKGRKLQIRARTEKLILGVDQTYKKPAIPGALGKCEPCSRKGHICIASGLVGGVAKCNGCASGTRCNYHAGSGWFRGDGSKGRPSDLASAKRLARKYSHGHNMRYLAGCRCDKCRAAHYEYNQALVRNRKLYGPNDLVSTDAVKAHLHWLQTWGIGHQTVSKICGVGKTALAEVLWSGKKFMRRRATAAVLAVKPALEHYPKNKPIDATETLQKLRTLIRLGIPRSLIARDCFDSSAPGLQIHSLKGKTPLVIVRTALSVRDYFELVMEMRRIWQKLHGPIPRRHYVYWKNGRHGMTCRSFELLPFSRTYDYCNVYPAELKKAMSLANTLRREYRARKKEGHPNGNEEQTHRSKKPSVRGAGTANRRTKADGPRSRQGSGRCLTRDHRKRQG